MLHPEMDLVTAENGLKPDGPPDKCFCCHEKVGNKHKDCCGYRRRTVVIRTIIEQVISVQPRWNKGMIEFARGLGGSWCASNFVDELKRFTGDCFCPIHTCEFVREATEKDEELWDMKDILG